MKQSEQCVKATGWNNGLCQDYNRKLHQWFASRVDARYVLRKNLTMNEVEWTAQVKSKLIEYAFNEEAAIELAKSIYDTYYEDYPNDPLDAVTEELSNWGD